MSKHLLSKLKYFFIFFRRIVSKLFYYTNFSGKAEVKSIDVEINKQKKKGRIFILQHVSARDVRNLIQAVKNLPHIFFGFKRPH